MVKAETTKLIVTDEETRFSPLLVQTSDWFFTKTTRMYSRKFL